MCAHEPRTNDVTDSLWGRHLFVCLLLGLGCHGNKHQEEEGRGQHHETAEMAECSD